MTPSGSATSAAEYSSTKVYFASERTFLHWLSVAVTLGGVAAGLLGISGEAHRKWGQDYEASAIAVRILGLFIMATSIALVVMAAWNFHSRGERLKSLSDGPYDSRWLPLLVSLVMLAVLTTVWLSSLVTYIRKR